MLYSTVLYFLCIIVDLQTQAGYQQMDSRFIGLIFSVYNEDKKTKVR